MRKPLAPALALALALVLAPALAQGAEPPATATPGGSATLDARHWIGPDAATIEHDVVSGTNATLWLALKPNATVENATRFVVFVNESAGSTLALPPATLQLDATATAWNFTALPFAAGGSVGPASYSLDVAVRAEGNESFAEAFVLSGSWTVVAPVLEEPAPPEGLSTPVLVGGAAVALVVLGGGAYALKRRNERIRMNRAPRRSQALREAEIERQVAKRPEQVAAVQQEIRREEAVREKRRELQILEAKRADLLKSIDLLRKRHETGGLSKLQFDNMVAKKQADLTRIEAEIAEMERQDRGAAA